MTSRPDITYVIGDATAPACAGPVIIAHVCNDIGAWGAGFVGALSKRWKLPEAEYRRWFRKPRADEQPFSLGAVQFVQVAQNICVANMIGQHGISRRHKAEVLPPIRYEALDQALEKVGSHAINTHASVHMPRIGCGLAGGTWDRIEPLVLTRLCDRGIAVTVYDLPQS
ncbi:MAG TPA: macro domain-containing protein [Prosthecobacter sp.]